MTERIRIERIATGGDGVGRLSDGRVAFVPRTAPGDLAAIEVVRPEKRFVRAELVDLVEPGPGRVEPTCPHYRGDRCGGCQLQHLDTDRQVEARRSILTDAMARIGRVAIAVPPVEPAALQWGYRSKISLTVGRNGAIGYHRIGEPGAVFALDRCPIAADGVNDLWHRVRRSRNSLPRHASRIILRLDRSGGEHLVIVTERGPIWSGGKALHQATSGSAPLTVWWQPEEGSVRAVAGSPSAYPATAFEQVHPAMGDRVRAHAIARAEPVDGRRAWDLYAGIGETSQLLADRGATVTSVEWDQGAVAEAERRQVGYGRRIERVTGPVEAVVASLGSPDLVLANPPRSGIDPATIGIIRARKPERVVYVSCDPATLARDVGRFADPALADPIYRVVELTGFDLFPQTAHLETVAVLERA